MKNFYSIDLIKNKAEQLKQFLRNNSIYFEPSTCYNLIHFEILASSEQVKKVNEFLQTL